MSNYYPSKFPGFDSRGFEMRERVRSGYTVEDSCDIRVFLEKFELLRDLFQEIRLFFKKKKKKKKKDMNNLIVRLLIW